MFLAELSNWVCIPYYYQYYIYLRLKFPKVTYIIVIVLTSLPSITWNRISVKMKTTTKKKRRRLFRFLFQSKTQTNGTLGQPQSGVSVSYCHQGKDSYRADFINEAIKFLNLFQLQLMEFTFFSWHLHVNELKSFGWQTFWWSCISCWRRDQEISRCFCGWI